MKAVLSAFFAATAVLAVSPAGSAQEEPDHVTVEGTQSDVGILGIGQATTVKYDPTWIRFRPNPYDGEHLTTRPSHNVATICFARGFDNKWWNLVYDHTQKFVGWTHEENLSPYSYTPCSSFGLETDLNGDSAWVHLAPFEDWAYETVNQRNDIATICYYQQTPSKRWEVVLEHGPSTNGNSNRVGFTYSSYLAVNKRSSTPCS